MIKKDLISCHRMTIKVTRFHEDTILLFFFLNMREFFPKCTNSTYLCLNTFSIEYHQRWLFPLEGFPMQ